MERIFGAQILWGMSQAGICSTVGAKKWDTPLVRKKDGGSWTASSQAARSPWKRDSIAPAPEGVGRVSWPVRMHLPPNSESRPYQIRSPYECWADLMKSYTFWVKSLAAGDSFLNSFIASIARSQNFTFSLTVPLSPA